MTAQQIINRALRLIGALPAGQTPSAVETADGLSALNAMLLRWEASGISMGFSPMSSAGATVPVPDEVEECIAYNLAVRIAPEYGVVIGQEIAALADEGLRALQRDATTVPRLDLDTPRTSGLFNINTGQYN